MAPAAHPDALDHTGFALTLVVGLGQLEVSFAGLVLFVAFRLMKRSFDVEEDEG